MLQLKCRLIGRRFLAIFVGLICQGHAQGVRVKFLQRLNQWVFLRKLAKILGFFWQILIKYLCYQGLQWSLLLNLYFLLHLFLEHIIFKDGMIRQILIYLPGFITFYFIIPEFMQKFFLNFGSELVIIKSTQFKVHASKLIEIYYSNVEAAQKDCRCAHQAGVECSQDGKALRRGQIKGFLIFPVPKHELFLSVTDGIFEEVFFERADLANSLVTCFLENSALLIKEKSGDLYSIILLQYLIETL